MIKKILKSLALLLLIFNFNLSLADDHLSDKDLIKSLKQKISEFDVKPFKKKSLLQKNVEYIEILKSQLSDLEKEKKKKDKIRAATAELEREIIALGGRPLTEGQDPLETDEVILSLKKQLEEIKAIKAEEKKAKEKAAAIALEKKQIKAAKKELIKEIEALGAKPVTETDPIDENDEIIALRKQLEEIKKTKDKLKADAEKEERIDEAKKELIKEIEALGAKPVTSTLLSPISPHSPLFQVLPPQPFSLKASKEPTALVKPSGAVMVTTGLLLSPQDSELQVFLPQPFNE